MIGDILKKIRKVRNLSKKTVANDCGITIKKLKFIEKNKVILNDEALKLFSKSLEVPLSILTFLNFDENEVHFKEEYIELLPVVEQFTIRLIKYRKKENKNMFVIKDNKEEQWVSGYWVKNWNFVTSKKMAKKFKYKIIAKIYSLFIGKCKVEKY